MLAGRRNFPASSMVIVTFRKTCQEWERMTEDQVAIATKAVAPKRSRWVVIISSGTLFFSIIGLLLLWWSILPGGDEYVSTWFRIAFSGLSIAGLLSSIELYRNQELSYWGIASLATAIFSLEACFLFTCAFDTNDFLLYPGLIEIWIGILLGELIVSPCLALAGLAKDGNKIYSIFSLFVFLVLMVAAFRYGIF